MSAASALAVAVVIGLAPGGGLPPGAVPQGVSVVSLDPALGLSELLLPRRPSAAALARLRLAPGVRFLGRPSLALEGCGPLADDPRPDARWRKTVGFVSGSAPGFVIGIADSGIDDTRLGLSHPLEGALGGDPDGHGTAVASEIAADRADLGVRGVARGVTLVSARICGAGGIEAGTLVAFRRFREAGAQVVNVSATMRSTRALRASLRALQRAGALVVAAAGNGGEQTFPASEPGVLGVGALARGSSTVVAPYSTRGPQVDLVAPAEGMPVLASSRLSVDELAHSPAGSSFAAPLAAGAAALVWSRHPAWRAAEVAAVLTRSAHPIGHRPNPSAGYGRLDIARALRTPRSVDAFEPNDWYRAARDLSVAGTVHATLGEAGDVVDGYGVELKAGRRLRVTASAGIDLALVGPHGTAALFASARGSRSSAIDLTVGEAGRYVIVATRREGAGPYVLRIIR